MTKPDWKDAPEWAQWLAQDLDGRWWWYECKPFDGLKGWSKQHLTRRKLAGESPVDGWKKSLRSRPPASVIVADSIT